MASLTITAYYARRLIKYGSIALVAALILRSLVISLQNYWRQTHPPPPPAPTVAFGKLPKLLFPSRTGLPPIALKQETIEGTFPALASTGKVYFSPRASTNLLAWEETKTWARRLGFTNEPETISDFDWRFTSSGSPRTTLEVNVLTRNFRLYYDWQSDVSLLSQNNLPQEDQAILIAKNYLQSANVLTADLVAGPVELEYLKHRQGNLVKTPFFSEASLARVNFFRQNLDELRMLPANPQIAEVSVLIASAVGAEKRIVEVKYTHFPISTERFATYPLKEVNQAWTQLANGKGFIASLGDNPDGKITVRKAYLAYYESSAYQNFFQPIIVFEGDRDFYAYVGAISDGWVE